MYKVMIGLVISSLLTTGLSVDDSLQIRAEREVNSQLLSYQGIEVKEEFKQEVKQEAKEEVKVEVEVEVKDEVKQEVIKNQGILKLINLGDKFTYRQGVKSEEVRELRYFLNSVGFTVDTSLYTYDNSLISAVKAYQNSRGLFIDGNVGSNTIEIINKEIQDKGIVIPELEIVIQDKTNLPKGNWVIINKTNNTLYHMTGNSHVKSYHVATGKTPSATPEGKFTILTKLVNPGWGGAGKYKPIRGGASNNPLGPRWMGLSIKGGGTYGVHGNADFSSLGKDASMGCVRMYNDEVTELYGKLGIGTEVWLLTQSKLKDLGIEIDWK